MDTSELVRALLIAFLEGAMIYGVFHGDLHGDNLLVMPDGRVALFDYDITGHKVTRFESEEGFHSCCIDR